MKKIYFLSITASLLFFAAFGQSQRLVLLEHFTGASCPPCATFNPAVNTLLEGNPDKIIGLKYQLAPPGTDPMYSHNPAHSGSRAGYYNVTGIPNSVLDGNFYNDHPANWGINQVNARYDVPSPYDIEISYEVSLTTVTATVSVTASQDFTDNNLRLHTVVVEQDISFATAPGTNGETTFKNVMKQMLPNQNGTTLPSTWTEGQTETFDLSWDHANVYDFNELAVIAFVQNNSTKEIHQAAINTDITLTSEYNLAAQAVSLTNLPGPTCEGLDISFTPEVTFLNAGSEELNSVDVVLNINGEEFFASWTGQAALLDQVVVDFDEITVQNIGVNNITANAIALNESDNELEGSLEVELDLSAAETTTYINVEIDLDNWPVETTWDIKNDAGATMASGGPYSGQNNQSISEPVELEEFGCYFFTIYDEYGDGLNGSQWGATDGSANITDDLGNVILSYDGSTEFEELTAAFDVVQLSTVSVENTTGMNALNLFPNPTSGILNVEFDLTDAQTTQIDIFDVAGKRVLSKALGTMGAGYHMSTIDMSAMQPGVYVINFTTEQGTEARKLMLTK
ncbi:MAG: T9SS type A sorting domain-containing protein [Cryomorphaceae bacterium]|nr:T9SS type A sorting domain-containing protein [Flavobacteriales bacterium]